MEYQINDNFMIHYFGNSLYLYDQKKRYKRITCNSVEADIISYVNMLHSTDVIWDRLCNLYGLDKCLDESKSVYNHYINLLKEKNIISEGHSERRTWGVPGKRYPVFLSIELTNRCNLKCSHCYKNAGPSNSKYISLELVKDVLRTLGRNIYSLDITGGEATLHPDFENLVSLIDTPKINLLTNGSNLEKISDNTLQKFDFVQVSMYGASEDEYEANTKTKAFNSVCRGLEKLVRLDVSTSIALILRKDNIRCISKYIDVLYSIGIKNVRFGMSLKIGRNEKGSTKWDISYEDGLRFENEIATLKERYPNMTIDPFCIKDNVVEPLPAGREYSLVCDAGRSELCISELGIVRPCVMLPEKYFGIINWDEYKSMLEKGNTIDWNTNISKCVQELKKSGKTIESLCPKAFDCV